MQLMVHQLRIFIVRKSLCWSSPNLDLNLKIILGDKAIFIKIFLNVFNHWLGYVSPCHLRIADKLCFAIFIACIKSTFLTFLLLFWGALLGARWIFKTVRNNRENISNFIYNTYNLTETTFQKVKVSVNRNKFN